MTDKTTTEAEAPEDGATADTTAETTTATDPAPQDGTETPDENEGGGREAAKYRRRLRETEAERDTLRGQLEALQRVAVEQVAGKHLRKPAGLWASGVTPAELLDDHGIVDPEKVATAARAAADTLGLSRPVGGNHVPREGHNPRPSSGASRFEDALRQG